MMESLRRLKAKAMALKPSVQIGKKGITDESIKEIRKQLKKNRLVKVKFLKSSFGKKDKKSMAKEIADRTQARLVSLVGFAAAYCKENKTAKII